MPAPFVLETDRVLVRTPVAADLPQAVFPLPLRALERPEFIDLVGGQFAGDVVAQAVLFVGVLHRAVEVAGVNLLVDVVQRVFDHLQLVLGRLGVGDVAADAEGVLAVERENTVLVVARPAVERDVVVRRGTAPRGEDVFEVVAHVAVGLGGEHLPDILPGDLAARNADMVGLLGGNKLHELPLPVEDGQHVGYGIEHFAGIAFPEAPGTPVRRSELPLKFLDPADQLLAGTVVISAHIHSIIAVGS